MYYLLEKNSKGFYEIEGRETRLVIAGPGVKIGTYDNAPLNATFQIGDDTYFIETGLCEDYRIMEVSRLVYNEAGEIVNRVFLEGLEILRNHPVTQFLEVGGVTLRLEPLV